jgi:heptosyltransferase-2
MFQAKQIPREGVKNILIRGTNWIGDVVMTLPAITAVREAYPEARISILVKPWVADLLRISPDVDEVMVYERPGIHEGLGGLFRLVRELKTQKFDMAILRHRGGDYRMARPNPRQGRLQHRRAGSFPDSRR